MIMALVSCIHSFRWNQTVCQRHGNNWFWYWTWKAWKAWGLFSFFFYGKGRFCGNLQCQWESWARKCIDIRKEKGNCSRLKYTRRRMKRKKTTFRPDEWRCWLIGFTMVVCSWKLILLLSGLSWSNVWRSINLAVFWIDVYQFIGDKLRAKYCMIL